MLPESTLWKIFDPQCKVKLCETTGVHRVCRSSSNREEEPAFAELDGKTWVSQPSQFAFSRSSVVVQEASPVAWYFRWIIVSARQ